LRFDGSGFRVQDLGRRFQALGVTPGIQQRERKIEVDDLKEGDAG